VYVVADINSTIRKIKALADGTNNKHERDSALEMFYALMDKHGVSESDLYDEAIARHDFKWKGSRELKLLHQIIFMVMESPTISTYSYVRGGRTKSNIMGIKCTTAQKLEIDFMFKFYKDLYHREEDTFFMGFIHKHRLFGPPSGKGKDMSDKEYFKMRQMMEGMDDENPQKRIAAGA
jgi:hypothetical protein